MRALEEEFLEEKGEEAWLLCSLVMSNNLSGHGGELTEGSWNRLQQRGARELRRSVQRMLAEDSPVPRSPSQIEKELADRFLTYTGEEVPKLLPLGSEQVAAALPPEDHGGSIDLLRLAKVHFQDGERMKVARLLVEKRICDWIPLSTVVKYRNQHVLNGLFAVGKDSTLCDGRQVQRCIMNLIPSNSILCKLEGSVRRLPHITQWLSITMEGDEEIRFFQSDMSAAFYLFYLPDAWRGYLSFNLVVNGSEINRDKDCDYALSCRVLPVGWASAVGIMQEVAERLSVIGQLPEGSRIDKMKPIPSWLVNSVREAEHLHKAWFHVYLDNFCAAEKVKLGNLGFQGELMHQSIEAAWSEYGVISSAKKKVSNSTQVMELGAAVGGVSKSIGASAERMIKLIQTTLWVIGCKKLKVKWVQMVAGRWVHILQFRRPGMSLLNEVWQYTSLQLWGKAMEDKVRKELFMCCLGCLTMHTCLEATISGVTTASDASNVGGAVGVARELSPLGASFVEWDQQETKAKSIPVMVLSLFNGIGGSFRCYDILGVAPILLISYDTSKSANRVVSRRWPHAIIEHDVKNCNKEVMKKWLFSHPELEAIHLWAGWPCVDLSSVKANRMNLAGEGSGLFYELPRILQDLKTVFGYEIEIRYFFENVFSMDVEAEQEITRILGRRPYMVNCSDSVPIQRPRFCWSNVDCEIELEGTFKVDEGRYIRIYMEADFPQDDQWLAPGAERHPDTVYPTCMKSIKRQQPPPQPAGLRRCSEDTVARWRADNFRFPPYQYRQEFLIWSQDKWRLINSLEREVAEGL
eukprot:Skav230889  [mRNA]  locus=scaffold2765:140650:143297:- [translate_table: standard]